MSVVKWPREVGGGCLGRVDSRVFSRSCCVLLSSYSMKMKVCCCLVSYQLWSLCVKALHNVMVVRRSRFRLRTLQIVNVAECHCFVTVVLLLVRQGRAFCKTQEHNEEACSRHCVAIRL